MTDTIGKIEQLSDEKNLGIPQALMLLEAAHIERVAKWRCIECDEDPVLPDGTENWQKFVPFARGILGVG